MKKRDDKDKEVGIEWGPKGLRRMWTVLEGLPPAAVEGNDMLASFERYAATGDSAGGYYRASDKQVGMKYGDDKVDTLNNSAADPGDPLYGVNRFDKVVRHEVGHAVDKKVKASSTYCETTAGGGWKDYSKDHGTVATEMIVASPGAIGQLTGDALGEALAALTAAVKDRDADTLMEELVDSTFWDDLDEDEQAAIEADPIHAALEAALSTPWYNDSNGGKALDGRIFQESYKKRWTSYAQTSRAKKVSQYQHRAPGEWFAEAYATYYTPSAKGDGALLQSVDSGTKKWFDDHVATLEVSR